MNIAADLRPIAELADELRGPLPDAIVADAGDKVSNELDRAAAAGTGGDRVLSGLGQPLGVEIRSTSGGQLVATLTGPWSIVFGGTRPHQITGRPHPSGGQPVVVLATARAGTRFRSGPVRHPGTRGRPELDAAWRRVPMLVEESTDEIMREAIG